MGIKDQIIYILHKEGHGLDCLIKASGTDIHINICFAIIYQAFA